MSARVRPALLLAVVVAVGVLAVLVVGGLRATTTSAAADRRQAIASTAEAFATTLLTYDHGDLDTTREDLADLATDEFRARIDDALADLGTEIEAVEARSTATVDRVLVQEPADGPTVHAVVVLDATVVAEAGTRELTDAHLDLTLASHQGTWRVDGMRQLAGQERIVGSEPTPTPS